MTNEERERELRNQFKIFCDMPFELRGSIFTYIYDNNIREKYPFFIADIACYLRNCKSQIEMSLAVAYVIVITKKKYTKENPYDYWFYSLEPQAEIEANGNRYYADFLFDTSLVSSFFNKPLKLVIECDGHDYHHASKEQVQKDYERETNLKMAGYDVLRFTGSQIYKDPMGCAKTIFEYILKKVGEEDGEEH